MSVDSLRASNSEGQVVLVGGHPAIDFVNTAYGPSGETVDLLADGAAMQRWLREAGPSTMELASASSTLTSEQWEEAAVEARQLRDWFRGILSAWSAAGVAAPSTDDWETLNRYLSRITFSYELVWSGAKRAMRQRRDIRNAGALVGALATFCADLLANFPSDRAHKCANPDCTLWFIDLKKGPARRWCSMAICGNRMKVAAHRARNKGTQSAS